MPPHPHCAGNAADSLLETDVSANVDGAEAFAYRSRDWPQDYRTMWRSILTLFRAFLGDFDFDFGLGVAFATGAQLRAPVTVTRPQLRLCE